MAIQIQPAMPSLMLLVAESWRAVAQTTTAPAATLPPATASPAVELVKALAWPIAAVSIGLAFYKPLSSFLSALGSRVTKLSVFKVEMELVPAKSATTTALLDDIRTATNPAEISDSSRSMLEQVQSREPADFAVVALGKGDEWLTSRLYIAAVMMERMRGVKVFVFTESTPETSRHFVAVASVSSLRWALARKCPWLEAAWIRAQVVPFTGNAAMLPDPRMISNPQPVIVSDTGGLDQWQARNVVSNFIDLLQRQIQPVVQPAAPAGIDGEWVALGGLKEERAAWVTRELLESILPYEVFSAWAPNLRDEPQAKRTRAVLRRHAPFVSLLEENREFVRLANRQALLEEIASSAGEEPDHA